MENKEQKIDITCIFETLEPSNMTLTINREITEELIVINVYSNLTKMQIFQLNEIHCTYSDNTSIMIDCRNKTKYPTTLKWYNSPFFVKN
jgi:hypothetical protein